MIVAQIIVWLAIVYLALGVIFGVYFVISRIGDFDETAKSAGYGFKLIILFGTVPFWPLIAWRMMRGVPRPLESNSHRRAAAD